MRRPRRVACRATGAELAPADGGTVSARTGIAAEPVAQPAPVARDPAAIEPAPVPGNSASPDVAAGAVQAIGKPQREMSPWSMFLSADILVKAVMVSLAFASLVTWTIFLAKTVQLSHARRKLRQSARPHRGDPHALGSATGAGLEEQRALGILVAAMHEVRMSADSATDSGIKERAASRFTEIPRVEARAVRYGMATLATIGATSPFVGLFGTVWGIMNSFIGISKAQTTNLAVVAPGIAEALLATAIGLVAAIPAVIIYNHFSRAHERLSSSLSAAARARSGGCCRATSTACAAGCHARAAE